MALYVPQLTFNKFRYGEVVEIDESEWTNVIERGWLKPYSEGEVLASQEAEDPAASEPDGDASLSGGGDALPPDDGPQEISVHAVDDDIALDDHG